MGKEARTKWACDICGREADTAADGVPSGWVVFEIDDCYEERCWHTKALCASCMKEVTAAIQRRH